MSFSPSFGDYDDLSDLDFKSNYSRFDTPVDFVPGASYIDEGINEKWLIHDFGQCQLIPTEFLKSPSYFSGPQKELEWCLHLYPKGDASVTANKFLSLHLVLIRNKSAKPVRARFEISILIGSHLVGNRSFSVYIKVKQRGKLHTFPKFAHLENMRSMTLVAYGYTPCTMNIQCNGRMNCEVDNLSSEYIMQHLSEDYESLFRDSKHSDVTLLVKEKKIPAHKNILASRSRVFAAMFDHEMKEKKSNVVDITDIDSEVFEDFLLFLYSGKAKFLDEAKFDHRAVCHLLSTAEKYDVPTLLKACASRLKHHLTVDNACEILSLANIHDVGNLKKSAIDFINANASRVIGTAGWEEMLNTSPTRLLADLYVAKVGKTGIS